MRASIKLMLGRCMTVQKDNSSSNLEWDNKVGMFNGKGLISFEGVVLYGDAIVVLELVLIKE